MAKPEQPKRLVQLGRGRRDELHLLACNRVRKGQLSCVQPRARQKRQPLVYERRLRPARIDVVAHDSVTYRPQVYSHLVRAAGLETTGDEGGGER